MGFENEVPPEPTREEEKLAIKKNFNRYNSIKKFQVLFLIYRGTLRVYRT